MNTTRISLLVTFSLLALACGPSVIDGAGQTNGNLNGGENTSGGGEGASGPTAVAMRYADVPWDDGSGEGSSNSTATTGGSGIDPDTLYLFLGTPHPSCGDPNPSTWCGGWSVTVGIPPELQVPGVLSLSDERLIAGASASGHNEGGAPDDCWGGGGSFWEGTIEIVSIDDAGLDIVLADTSTFDFDADGSYHVARCQ